ncbi:MAG: hypothetical protein NTV32_09855 [Gammaproteobacteria bacterium]|nr:hypothetical protein [Gammaproteobacteria bacterium]
MKFIDNILNSLKANDEGFSVKKELSVLFGLSCIIMSWYIIKVQPDLTSTIYITNISFIATLLGIGALQTTTEKKINKDVPFIEEPKP